MVAREWKPVGWRPRRSPKNGGTPKDGFSKFSQKIYFFSKKKIFNEKIFALHL